MHIPQKLFKSIREISAQDKIDEFKQDGLSQRVSRIPISRTFYELSEMDLVDDGDGGTILHLQDTLPDTR